MKVSVKDFSGKKTNRSIELPDDIFNFNKVNQQSLYLSVKQYLSSQRQGNAKVKGRSEVKGSSKKLHRQKGTGGSRKGNIRNPLYKGGGTVHGPEPRSYSFKLNKRVKDLAKISALTSKMKSDDIIVLEDFDNYKENKTKALYNILRVLELENKKVSFISEKPFNESFSLSSRNLRNVLLIQFQYLNVYDILNSNVLIFSETILQAFNQKDEEEANNNPVDQKPQEVANE